MVWEDELARDIRQAEQRDGGRGALIAQIVAMRDWKVVELWRLIDGVIERANARVSPAGMRFQSVEQSDPRRKEISYGERTLRLELEPLRYDARRQEPAFYPGGIARMYVEPPAQDLTDLFCAFSSEGARWLAMPSRKLVTEETVGMMLRALLR